MLLVGLGAVAPRLLSEAADALRAQLGVTARAVPALDRPTYALNEPRGQYHAPAILRRLAGLRASADASPVLGVTDVDLFVPDVKFVVIDADRGARAAVISIARLASPDPAVVARRLRAEAVHGAGQLLGLSPCHDFRCAIADVAEAIDVDRKGPGPCGACRAALGI